MPVLSTEERIGRTLGGKYKVGPPIATGGMGVVYRGEHTWTGRAVAIKALLPGLSADEEISRRFLTEARASASIRHPNVVDVLDMGKDDDGTLYMVLELLEGRDFQEVLETRRKLQPPEAVAVVAPILDALAFAHQKGFVHRDMKPSNIFLSVDARGAVVPKVLDFGIAKALDGGANKTTRTGVVIGTPHYMAPEQASGVGVIGPASDTWSMGVILFEALSGKVPFDGASPTIVLMNVLARRAPPIRSLAPELSTDLATLVDAMLDPDPDARPADLRAHAKKLRDVVGGDPERILLALADPEPKEVGHAAAPPVFGPAPPRLDTERVDRQPQEQQAHSPLAASSPRSNGDQFAVPSEPVQSSWATPRPAFYRTAGGKARGFAWVAGAMTVATLAAGSWWWTKHRAPTDAVPPSAEPEVPSGSTEPSRSVDSEPASSANANPTAELTALGQQTDNVERAAEPTRPTAPPAAETPLAEATGARFRDEPRRQSLRGSVLDLPPRSRSSSMPEEPRREPSDSRATADSSERTSASMTTGMAPRPITEVQEEW